MVIAKRIFSGVKRPSLAKIILLVASIALAVVLASGVAWALTKIGTDGRDTLVGTNGVDTLVGKGGNDRIYGLAAVASIGAGLLGSILSPGVFRTPFCLI